MGCHTCNELLAAYRNAVSVFKDAVQTAPGATGADSCLAAKPAARLGEQCKEASDALMEHWRVEHRSLAAKGGV